MEVEFSGELDGPTFLRALKLANRPSTLSAVLRVLGTVLYVGARIALAANLLLSGPLDGGDWFSLAGGVVQSGVVAAWLLAPFYLPYYAAWRQRNAAHLRGGEEGIITAQGISTREGSSGMAEIPWSYFTKRRTSEDLIVLVGPHRNLHVLPRHYFRNEADWTTVRRWVDFSVKPPR